MTPEAHTHGNLARRDPSIGTPFVGRRAEVERLIQALEEAADGRGSLFLVGGEPGIGKTRLCDEFATLAREREATVLWGRCWEAGGAPAYWPWLQALRSSIRGADPEVLERRLAVGAADLAHVLPELRRVLPDLPEPHPGEPETARFRLFDAIYGFLSRAADERPLALVLDDIHAADEPSLLLLRFVGTLLGQSRLLVVAAYRDVALPAGATLAPTLSELEREPTTHRSALGGLTPEDVALLVERAADGRPDPSLARAIHRETEGNPLFVGEIVRLLAAEGSLSGVDVTRPWLAIPQTVHDVIARRLDHLPEACRPLLSEASVLGREFSIEALQRMSGTETPALLSLLNEAAAARIITDVPGALGRLRFAHALVRDALYDVVPVPRRYELHGHAADVLEEIHGGDLDPHLAEIAHHRYIAASTGAVDEAARAARRAGDHATSVLAFEESVRLYGMALETLSLKRPPDQRDRCDVLLALGEAQVRAGDVAAAKATFLDAGGIARVIGDADRLARAALGYGGRFAWLRAGADAKVVPLLEEALERLPEVDGELRVRNLARLSGALRDDLSRDRRDALSGEALSMARRVGDPAPLAYALVARYTAIWGPDNAEELLSLATELVSVARDLEDQDVEVEGHLLRHKALMQLGRIHEAYREHEESLRLSEALRQPPQQWYCAADRASFALLEGRFDEAEELIERARALGETAQPMEAESTHVLQRFGLRRERGGLHRLEHDVRQAVHRFSWYPLFHCVLANLYVHIQREADARQLLAEIASNDFASLPFDNEWLFAMSLLPEVADALGDAEAALRLYEVLLPFAGLHAYSAPELANGPVDRYLGLAAAAADRLDDAVRHFEDAETMARHMGARPFVGHTQAELARALLRRGRDDDGARARKLLAEAETTARELGMAPLALTIELARAEAASDGEPTDGSGGTFRKKGDFWDLSFEGRATRLRDAKGMRYLHRLLEAPGQEIHVAELAVDRSPMQAPQTEGLGIDVGNAGEILDERAKAAYRARIEDLREEIEDGERSGDPERVSRATEELEFLAKELSAAFGLGGRPRRGADVNERIRKAVGNRIRVALARIEREHRPLALHLRNAVTTGTFCVYRPDRPIRWLL